MTSLLKALWAVACVLFFANHLASAQEYKGVKLAYLPTPDSPQLLQVLDKGLFKKAGLEVGVTSFPTGREALEALVGGQVDFAVLAEFPAVIAAMRNQQFGIIADISRYRGTKVITSNLPITSFKDLAGRKIGTTLGTNMHFMTEVALKQAGVQAEVINISPPDLVAALARGDIDAAVMFSVFYDRAKRTLGERYRDLVIQGSSQHLLLVASSKMIQTHPMEIKQFVSALLEGQALLDANVAETQETVVRGLRGMVNVEFVRSMWGENDFNVNLDKALLDLMVEEGLWIRDRGFVKSNEAPDEKLFRSHIIVDPLKSLAPQRVTLR